MACYHQNMSKAIIATFLIMCITFHTGTAKPSSKSLTKRSNVDLESPVDTSLYNGDLSPHIIRQIQKCDIDLESMELCMRCAKVTKSEIVYPMCCDNEDGVKEWCHEYIFYGATPSPS